MSLEDSHAFFHKLEELQAESNRRKECLDALNTEISVAQSKLQRIRAQVQERKDEIIALEAERLRMEYDISHNTKLYSAAKTIANDAADLGIQCDAALDAVKGSMCICSDGRLLDSRDEFFLYQSWLSVHSNRVQVGALKEKLVGDSSPWVLSRALRSQLNAVADEGPESWARVLRSFAEELRLSISESEKRVAARRRFIPLSSISVVGS